MNRAHVNHPVFTKEKKSPACSVCKGPLRVGFENVRDPITNDSFSILSCPACGLGQTYPVPEDLTPYYGGHYYGRRHGAAHRHFLKRALRTIAPIAQGSGSRRLLDVGCGDGSFMLAAKKSGWEVVGTERHFSPARNIGLDVNESIEELKNKERFHCVTMWHSLEHMPNIMSTLRTISSLLYPGGRLVVAVPNSASWQASIFGSRWLHLDVPRHLYHFDPISLSFCLNHAGFDVKHFLYQEFEYDLMGWIQSALHCLSPSAPHLFLNFLMGKEKFQAFLHANTASHVVLGFVLAPLFSSVVPLCSLFRRSGTMTAIAAKFPGKAKPSNI